ncbi:MAG: XRE family transcriptional regulator [Proteobacteria bacterium]|nr:XRE family transcriptional regulator [Pseudomonadota bacterium]
MAKKKKNIGSSFDDFLEEDGLLVETTAEAIKRILAWQIAEAMKTDNISKSEMARRMQTSRASLDRLLDPDNSSVTLKTMHRAATVLGKQIRMELVG